MSEVTTLLKQSFIYLSIYLTVVVAVAGSHSHRPVQSSIISSTSKGSEGRARADILTTIGWRSKDSSLCRLEPALRVLGGMEQI